jgi:hypothetical protein
VSDYKFGQLIRAEQAFKILLISSLPDEIFYFRECILVFTSVSVVGMNLIPGNFTGNVSTFPILCKDKLSVIVRKNIEGISKCSWILYFSIVCKKRWYLLR